MNLGLQVLSIALPLLGMASLLAGAFWYICTQSPKSVPDNTPEELEAIGDNIQKYKEVEAAKSKLTVIKEVGADMIVEGGKFLLCIAAAGGIIFGITQVA